MDKTSKQPSVTFSIPAISGSVFPIDLCYAEPNEDSEWFPHGQLLPCVMNKERKRYIWCDVGSFTMSTTVSTTAQFVVYRAEDDNEAEDGVLAWTSTTGNTYSVTNPGYFRFECTANSNAGIFSLSSAGIGPVFQHLMAHDMDTSITDFARVRVLGASLMYTNNASLNSLEGMSCGVQMPGSTPWLSIFQGGYDEVSTTEGAYPIRATNGMYGYICPEDNKCFDYQDWFTVDDGELVSTQVPLVPEYDYAVIALTITNTSGQDGMWMYVHGLEFQTKNRLFASEKPTNNRLDYEQACDLLRAIPQFTENDSHISDIWNWVKNAASNTGRFILDKGPALIDLGRQIYNGYQAIGGPLSQAMTAGVPLPIPL